VTPDPHDRHTSQKAAQSAYTDADTPFHNGWHTQKNASGSASYLVILKNEFQSPLWGIVWGSDFLSKEKGAKHFA
jgi:hypothetical protein